MSDKKPYEGLKSVMEQFEQAQADRDAGLTPPAASGEIMYSINVHKNPDGRSMYVSVHTPEIGPHDIIADVISLAEAIISGQAQIHRRT